MHIERLEKLLQVMESYPAIKKRSKQQHDMNFKFDIGTWATVKCSTSACALGTAAMLPWFNRRGLRLVPLSESEFLAYDYVPAYKGALGVSAAMKFFDLTDYDASFLFLPRSYYNCDRITPKMVAKRIKRLLGG